MQDGARLHYAIPIALQRAGILDRVFTEWYSSPFSLARLLSRITKLRNPTLGQRMIERYNPDLDPARIISSPLLEWRLTRFRRKFTSAASFFNWQAAERARWIRRTGFGNANVLMGYAGNIDPDLLAEAQTAGLRTIADQFIAPSAIAAREDQLQQQRFPEWGSSTLNAEHELWNKYEHATWPRLDRITCASSYVRDGLRQQGVADEKISVIPYPIDASHFPVVDRSNRTGPVTVGFVGRVNLRKGAPYFLEVARRFDPKQVKFMMVGPVDLPAEIAARFAPHVELIGSVPRSQVSTLLARFDIYFFPSTCEGSAGSVSEAMCTGLPVVTSPNAGSVIRSGQDGLICNYDDIDVAAEHLRSLVADRDLRLEMGRKAAEYYQSFDDRRYARELSDLVRSLVDAPPREAISDPLIHPHP